MAHTLSTILPKWGVAADPRNGDKRPRGIHPVTGAMIPLSVSEPDMWLSYEQAQALAARIPGSCVGALLRPEYGITVIDIDKGHPADPMATVNFMGSYAERSSSGHGVHIFTADSTDGGFKSPSLHLEVYGRDRFIICTGDTVMDAPIEPRPKKLAKIIERIGKSSAVGSAGTSSAALTTVPANWPADVMARAREVVRKVWGDVEVKCLWKGDWQGMGFESQSEADASLLERLCFASDDDEAIMCAFHQSALGQREKARVGKYLPRTIAFIRQRKSEHSALMTEAVSSIVAMAEESARKQAEKVEEVAPQVQSDKAVIAQLLAQVSALTEQVASLTAQLAAERNKPAEAPVIEQPKAEPKFSEPDEDGVVVELEDTFAHIDYNDPESRTPLPKGRFRDMVQAIADSAGNSTPADFAVASVASTVAGMAARTVCSRNTSHGTGIYSMLVAPPGAGKGISSLTAGIFSQHSKYSMMASTVGGRASVTKLRSQTPAGVLHWSEIGTDLARMSEDQSGSVGVRQIIQMFDRCPDSPPEASLVVGGSVIPRHYYMSVLSDTQPLYLDHLLSRDSAGSGVLSRLTVVMHESAGNKIGGKGKAIPGDVMAHIRNIAMMPVRTEGAEEPGYVTVRFTPEAERVMKADELHWARVLGGMRKAGNHTAADYCARINARAERLATAIAVGNDPYNPVVSEEIAVYAINFVLRHYHAIRERLLIADRSSASLATERLHKMIGESVKEGGSPYVTGPVIQSMAMQDKECMGWLSVAGRGDEMKGLSTVLRFMCNDSCVLKKVKTGGPNGITGYMMIEEYKKSLYGGV